MSLRKLKRSTFKKSRKNLSSQYSTFDASRLFEVAQGCLRSGNYREAEKVYKKIVTAFPANASAHNDLGTLYHSLGNLEKASVHYKKAISIDNNNIQAMTNYGLVMLGQKKFDEALVLYQKVIVLRSDFVEAHYGLGLALKGKGKPEDAIMSFRKALSVDPDHVDALRSLGITYAELEQFDEAVLVYEKLVGKDPDNIDSLNKYAILLKKCGKIEEAVSIFKKVLHADPEFLAARFSLVEALEQYNKIDAAYAEVLEGLEHIPDDPSLLALAATCERRLGKFEKGIARFAKIKIDQLNLTNQRQCCFELARLYDKVADYDKAYEFFASGNQASKKLNKNIDKNYLLDRISLLQQQFQGCDSPPEEDSSLRGKAPVFLFGFLRSGTTLLDQILDSHPRIQTMEERDIIKTLEDRLADPFEEYYTLWRQVTPERIKMLQDQYYSEVERYLQLQPETVFIDRMPLHTMRAAFIRRIFPDAKFIMAIRHPLDVCLSCFMQDFKINTANANFFTLQDAAFFYAEVMKLWCLYVDRIPFNFHIVRYEDLVADLEGQARRIFEFLALDWDKKALAFHEHAKEKGQIKTASYHQVIQPIYRHSAYRWRHYAEFCEPFAKELAPFIEYFGYNEE